MQCLQFLTVRHQNGGRVFTCIFPNSTPIGMVKLRAATALRVPSFGRLYFNGRMLMNDQTLLSAGVFTDVQLTYAA